MQSSQEDLSFFKNSTMRSFSDSIRNLRLIGYVLLLLFSMDVVALLYPLDLMNPEWEFQAVGNIIERIVVPIIGIGFIFFGESDLRHKWEQIFLNLLSWICLLVGIIFMTIIPLIIVTSSQRIAVQIDSNLGDQYQQQISQSQAIQSQIETASRTDLEAFIASQGEIREGGSPEQVRQELLEDLMTARLQAREQVQLEINQLKSSVKKNAVKWILGSIISGFLLAYIWHITRWAHLSFRGMKHLIATKQKVRRA